MKADRITPHDVVCLAVEAGVDPDTVRRYLRGGVARRSTTILVERAAAVLRMRLSTTPAAARSTSAEQQETIDAIEEITRRPL